WQRLASSNVLGDWLAPSDELGVRLLPGAANALGPVGVRAGAVAVVPDELPTQVRGADAQVVGHLLEVLDRAAHIPSERLHLVAHAVAAAALPFGSPRGGQQ